MFPPTRASFVGKNRGSRNFAKNFHGAPTTMLNDTRTNAVSPRAELLGMNYGKAAKDRANGAGAAQGNRALPREA
jgi:hypothetical protein